MDLLIFDPIATNNRTGRTELSSDDNDRCSRERRTLRHSLFPQVTMKLDGSDNILPCGETMGGEGISKGLADPRMPLCRGQIVEWDHHRTQNSGGRQRQTENCEMRGIPPYRNRLFRSTSINGAYELRASNLFTRHSSAMSGCKLWRISRERPSLSTPLVSYVQPQALAHKLQAGIMLHSARQPCSTTSPGA